MNKLGNAIAALAVLSAPVAAQEAVSYSYDGDFDDAAFGVESAILDRGLVIDFVSKVGEMLNRTGADVGSDTVIFDNADVYLFCSAVLSRKVMEADPDNIVHCPYKVFVTEREGIVSVGYPKMPEGPMQVVEALLDEIAREAVAQ